VIDSRCPARSPTRCPAQRSRKQWFRAGGGIGFLPPAFFSSALARERANSRRRNENVALSGSDAERPTIQRDLFGEK
jgi:hypothetical protein